jgi:hypothetical protein
VRPVPPGQAPARGDGVVLVRRREGGSRSWGRVRQRPPGQVDFSVCNTRVGPSDVT